MSLFWLKDVNSKSWLRAMRPFAPSQSVVSTPKSTNLFCNNPLQSRCRLSDLDFDANCFAAANFVRCIVVKPDGSSSGVIVRQREATITME